METDKDSEEIIQMKSTNTKDNSRKIHEKNTR